MQVYTNEFDVKAAAWDENPMHRERSEAVANGIIASIPLNANMTALEFGAGTGSTSLILSSRLKEITLIDSSEGMVKMTREKIRKAGLKNLHVLNLDLEHDDYEGKFDLIFTQMVLHHINDPDAIICKFRRMMFHGGHIAIADLYKEDGSFHGTGFAGHNGFDPEELGEILKKNGFADPEFRDIFTISKTTEEGKKGLFEVFLLTAKVA